jgi:hypothetical protein
MRSIIQNSFTAQLTTYANEITGDMVLHPGG